MTPAIIVHMNRPSMPCSATMPATTTTKAPVGPPICVAGAAERGDEEAGDDRAVDPACGGRPDAIANAIASGSATMPTVTPAMRS